MDGYVIFISTDNLNDRTNICKIFEFSINDKKRLKYQSTQVLFKKVHGG